MRVLVVEDHSTVRRALRRVLTVDLDAVLVGEAATGEEAVALAAELRPDIVLLDVHLPGMHGPDVASRLRQDDPHVRIVALTAAADPASVAAMIAAGADSYLVKTAPGQEIRDGLARILAGQAVLAAEVLPGVVADLASRLRMERERADALDELDRMKREFISLVSDRLNTPLTAISGYAKTMRNGWDRLPDEMKQEFCERIDSQAEHLGHRLAQILSVTRLQGPADGDGAPFALDAVVREVHVALGDRASGREVDLQLDEAQVSGDRASMAAAVRAILDNAIEHTDGAVRVRMTVDDDHALLKVDDEGPGVDPEEIEAHLEEPFVGGEDGDARGTEGLGLSLYLARRIVEAAGGSITIQSNESSGTSVTLRLPIARPR
jgi:signal transduction histidine kinase